MQIYVINLNRSEDRLRLIKAQIQNLGLEFVRVEAIDGSKLDESYLAERKIVENTCFPEMACWSLSEVACNLSHAKALELIANGPDEYGVVLEDDALFARGAARFLRDSSWIPENTNFIKLDRSLRKVLLRHNFPIDEGYELYTRCSSDFLATGYIVSRNMAEYLYPILQKTPLLVDNLYYSFEFGMAQQLQVLQLAPAIIQPSGIDSEIHHLNRKKFIFSKLHLIYMYKRLHSKIIKRYLDLGGKYKYLRVTLAPFNVISRGFAQER